LSEPVGAAKLGYWAHNDLDVSHVWLAAKLLYWARWHPRVRHDPCAAHLRYWAHKTTPRTAQLRIGCAKTALLGPRLTAVRHDPREAYFGRHDMPAAAAELVRHERAADKLRYWAHTNRTVHHARDASRLRYWAQTCLTVSHKPLAPKLRYWARWRFNVTHMPNAALLGYWAHELRKREARMFCSRTGVSGPRSEPP
jgi:hypothetical protein